MAGIKYTWGRDGRLLVNAYSLLLAVQRTLKAIAGRKSNGRP